MVVALVLGYKMDEKQLIQLRDTIISRPQDIFLSYNDCIKIYELFIDNLNIVNKELKDIYSAYAYSFFSEQINICYSYNNKKKLFSSIQHAKYLLNDEAKINISVCLLQNEQKFYNSCFHLMIQTVVQFVPQDEDMVIGIIKRFNGNINADDLNTLLNKIPNGENNNKIIDTLKKCKIYQILKQKEIIDEDPKTRINFFKFIGKMPSLIEKINFDIKMNIDDLHILPPVARFNFIQYYFRYKVASLEYPVSRYNTQNANNSKVKLDFIGYDQMKELLFPVSIRKNIQVSDWLNKYSVYLKTLQG